MWVRRCHQHEPGPLVIRFELTQKSGGSVRQIIRRVSLDFLHPSVDVELPIFVELAHRETVEVGRGLSTSPVVEVLADHRRRVPGVMQVALHRVPLIDAWSVTLPSHPRVVSELPSHKGCSERTTEWRRGECARELYAPVTEEFLCPRHELHQVRALVVGDDDEYVRFVRLG
jgi:hypothetical protein